MVHVWLRHYYLIFSQNNIFFLIPTLNFSFEIYLDKISSLLDTQPSLSQKSSKCKLKFKTKCWSPQVLKINCSKNKLLKKFSHLKEPHKKLVIMSTKNTEVCYPPFWKEAKSFFKNFDSNWNNFKNTYKGIKSIIRLKDISTSVPRTLNHNSTVTNPVEIANIFNNHFASVAEKTRANVNYSHKHFSACMGNKFSKSFCLSPTNKNEISSIISNLNPKQICWSK